MSHGSTQDLWKTCLQIEQTNGFHIFQLQCRRGTHVSALRVLTSLYSRQTGAENYKERDTAETNASRQPGITEQKHETDSFKTSDTWNFALKERINPRRDKTSRRSSVHREQETVIRTLWITYLQGKILMTSDGLYASIQTAHWSKSESVSCNKQKQQPCRYKTTILSQNKRNFRSVCGRAHQWHFLSKGHTKGLVPYERPDTPNASHVSSPVRKIKKLRDELDHAVWVVEGVHMSWTAETSSHEESFPQVGSLTSGFLVFWFLETKPSFCSSFHFNKAK